jgi:hypothetical protein
VNEGGGASVGQVSNLFGQVGNLSHRNAAHLPPKARRSGFRYSGSFSFQNTNPFARLTLKEPHYGADGLGGLTKCQAAHSRCSGSSVVANNSLNAARCSTDSSSSRKSMAG